MLEERKRLLQLKQSAGAATPTGAVDNKSNRERDRRQREQSEADSHEDQARKREELKRKRMALLRKELGAKAPPPEVAARERTGGSR